MIQTSTVFDWSTRVTNRWTDGQAIVYARSHIMLSLAKNPLCCFAETSEMALSDAAWVRSYLGV